MQGGKFSKLAGVGLAAVLAACGGSSTTGTTGDSASTGTTATSGTQTCSATNCAGCCFNGQCQSGNTASACGKDGATCAACGASQICKTDQTCGVDPDGTWLVQPTAATITQTNNGTSWDGDSSGPDVFINMQCPATTPVSSHTPTADDTWTPSWSSGGCTTKASFLLAQPFVFQPWDEDLTSDDPISDALQIQFTEANLSAGTVNATGLGGLQTITFQLTKQ